MGCKLGRATIKCILIQILFYVLWSHLKGNESLDKIIKALIIQDYFNITAELFLVNILKQKNNIAIDIILTRTY